MPSKRSYISRMASTLPARAKASSLSATSWRVLTECLTSDGHTVEAAANGDEALKRFLAGSFDLVVTDRAMPQMTGEQLAVAVKRVAPQTPIILLTGFGDMMNAYAQKPHGIDLILPKPITLAQLREAVAKMTAR